MATAQQALGERSLAGRAGCQPAAGRGAGSRFAFCARLGWRGLAWLAFLGLLQIMAVVLNLVPVPPFDGYRAVAPFLDPEVRARVDQASNIIMLAVFFLLWYVPVVNNFFWSVVEWISFHLQIPLALASLGLRQFQFWR